jgi:hypothetical protein
MELKDGLIYQRLWPKCTKFRANQASNVDKGYFYFISDGLII